MKVDVEELSPIQRKLKIEVAPELIGEELDKAYGQLARQVKIPGFRPGHIPRRLLEQRFSKQVEEDVTHRVMERAILLAIKEKQVDAVGSPELGEHHHHIHPGEPFSFEATVEIKPSVEAKDYRDLPLKKIDRAVDEAKITERLQELRERIARLEPVEGREVAQAGDFAVIDYEGTIDGRPFAGNKAENVTVEVRPGDLTEGKVSQLEGVKVGDRKEMDYAFAPDYPVEEAKGKVGHFTLTLKGLKTQITPEINDELAKEVGAFQTLEELKAKIRGDLEAARKAEADREERDQLITALVAKNELEVPRAMVERAVDMMLEGALRSLARSGLDPRQLNLDFESLRAEMRPRAQSEVKGTLLFEAVAQKEGIEPSDEEIEARIAELAKEAQRPLYEVKKQFRSKEQREGLRLRLREEKTIEFLKAHAKYS